MSNNFGLFFTRDSTVIRLPVNPEKLPVARGTDNDNYNVLGIGPIVVPRTPSLREVTISSYFPGRTFPGVLTSGGFKTPEFYMQFFRSAMIEKAPIIYTPVRYYENGEPFMTGDTGMQVVVTQFDTEERGGETGDFYYDLTLTEYKVYDPQTIHIQQPATVAQPAIVTKTPTREIPQGQLYSGALCTANGRYYSDSYGGGPSGNANGRRVIITRIVDQSRSYPIHVKAESGTILGWMAKSALQTVSTT